MLPICLVSAGSKKVMGSRAFWKKLCQVLVGSCGAWASFLDRALKRELIDHECLCSRRPSSLFLESHELASDRPSQFSYRAILESFKTTDWFQDLSISYTFRKRQLSPWTATASESSIHRAGTIWPSYSTPSTNQRFCLDGAYLTNRPHWIYPKFTTYLMAVLTWYWPHKKMQSPTVFPC